MNVQSVSAKVTEFQLDVYAMINDLKRTKTRYTAAQQLLKDLHELGCTQTEIMVSAHLKLKEIQRIVNGDDTIGLFNSLLRLWAQKDLERQGLWPYPDNIPKNNVPRVTKRSV
jgi:hypothetical protein